jgi:hypothetical protein
MAPTGPLQDLTTPHASKPKASTPIVHNPPEGSGDETLFAQRSLVNTLHPTKPDTSTAAAQLCLGPSESHSARNEIANLSLSLVLLLAMVTLWAWAMVQLAGSLPQDVALPPGDSDLLQSALLSQR